MGIEYQPWARYAR